MRSPALVPSLFAFASIGLFLLVSLIAPATVAASEWIRNGIPISDVLGSQYASQAIADGNGGTIVVWQDTWAGNQDIFAQRIDAQGNALWAPDGVPVCTATRDQVIGGVVSDERGGILVSWYDNRVDDLNPDVYVQRVDALGARQWGTQGTAICTDLNPQVETVIVSDGTGGAIVAWIDLRWDPEGDIVAQRVDKDGTPQWTPNGIPVAIYSGWQWGLNACTDGVGGVFLSWTDYRYGDNDIFVIRVDHDGNLIGEWGGRDITSIIGTSESHSKIVEDGFGGAVVIWQDLRDDGGDLYAMRVDATTQERWSAHVPVASEDDRQEKAALMYDPVNKDFIVAWEDYRDMGTTGMDIYTQRFDGTGKMQWDFNGIAVCSFSNNQFEPHLATDGEGGAILAWEDARYSPEIRLYTSRVTQNGVELWGDHGIVVSDAAEPKRQPFVVPDTVGGAFIFWDEHKTGDVDLYAQRVEPSFGYFGYPEPVISSVEDIPGDQGGFVRVNWLPGDHDGTEFRDIGYYSIWRATGAVSKDQLQNLVVLEDVVQGFEGPALRAAAAGDYYWEYVGEQIAQGFSGYSFATATEADSSASGPAAHMFQVVSHAFTQHVIFPSVEASGYSVDNLAPAAPNSLVALRLGGSLVSLDWSPSGENEADFSHYAVYRGQATGLFKDDGDLIGTTPDSLFTDGDAFATIEYRYVVKAVDIHGNISAPSNEAIVIPAVGVDEPITRQTRFLGAYPNPFNPTTMIRFELAQDQRVRLEIYDVAGRLVRVLLANEPARAGMNEARWNGQDASGSLVASGVYLCRFQSGSVVGTQRVTLMK